MSKQLPNDVVGETVDMSIGSLETELEIHSFEFEWTNVSYKPNRVHVRGRTTESNRRESVLGPVEFVLTEGKWEELNREEREGSA